MSLRVAVIDDDVWKCNAMAEKLKRRRSLQVVDAIDQDTAALWSTEHWSSIDIAVVDVFDDVAPAEAGTDMYSGITAIEHAVAAGVKVLAILPHHPHPLVQARLHEAAPHSVYYRWELPSLDELVAAISLDDPARVPRRPESDLATLGALNLRCNEAVAAYLQSPLGGSLRYGVGHKHLNVPRRSIDGLRREVTRLGFEGTESLSLARSLSRVP